MRLFGGDRMYNMMNSIGLDENTPIENRMLSGAINLPKQGVKGLARHP